MEESVELFWANFEKETGEKVLSRTMAQRYSSPKDRGDWGLLVLSPTGLRFRPTPGQNWFSSLFKASSAPAPSQTNEDIFIPYATMLNLESPQRRFMDFLFGTPFLAFDLRFSSPGGEKQLRFAVDPKSDFLDKLKTMREKSG
ncbi:MAG: hypothetical protein RBT73_01450 [Spirochaetia bacterium]|jgi:hypothetical protein|nr:hypothetical protein [Spirochaetia bacterium]